MWEIDYSDEVKFYFLDNYPYTFELLVKIEELRLTADGLPDKDYRLAEGGFYWWEVLDHVVIYRMSFVSNRIRIFVVKPLT